MPVAAYRNQPVAPTAPQECVMEEGAMDRSSFLRPSDFGGGGYFGASEETEGSSAVISSSSSSSSAPQRKARGAVPQSSEKFINESGCFLDDDPMAVMMANAKNICRRGPPPVQTSPIRQPRRSVANPTPKTPKRRGGEGTPATPKAGIKQSTVGTPGIRRKATAQQSVSRPQWYASAAKQCSWKSLDDFHVDSHATTRRRSANTSTQQTSAVAVVAAAPPRPVVRTQYTENSFAASYKSFAAEQPPQQQLEVRKSLALTYPPTGAVQQYAPEREREEVMRSTVGMGGGVVQGGGGGAGGGGGGAVLHSRTQQLQQQSNASAQSIRDQLSLTKLRLEKCLGGYASKRRD